MILQDKKYKYQVVYERIKEQILSGNYQPHEKLLSKRKISEQFNVSINSVIVALDQLIVEGYLYSLERKGYFVEDITHYSQDTQKWPKLPEELKEKPYKHRHVTSFSHMATNLQQFPYNEWAKCEHKAFHEFRDELSHLSHQQGPYTVRQTLAKHLNFKRGVRCEPEQIIFHSSSQGLMSQVLALFEPGTIALENPGYARYRTLIEQEQWHVHPVPIDEQGFNVAHVKSDVKLLYTTPAHQFPMGVIMPISRRFELLNWLNVPQERYIIEDDYDSEYKYETAHIPSLQSLDKSQRTIYMGTFSKTLFPGIRISYMVLPPALLKRYKEHFSHLLPSCNTLNLYTLHYFMKDGYYQKHLATMAQHFESIRKKLIQELRHVFDEKLTIVDIPAGLHFIIHYDTTTSYEEIIARAQEENVELFTLERFLLTMLPTANRSFIIGFANLQMNEIPKAVQKLKTVLTA